MKLEKRLQWFFERKLIMLFLWEERFLNPLIPDDMTQLKNSGLLQDKETLQLMDNIFPESITQLPIGMYFPVPISKQLKQGNDFSTELAMHFHYDFIKVDQHQKWSLREKNISGKVLDLFKSNLFYEKESKLYFVEYWSDNRWDKCYLECEITPMRALALELVQKEFKMQFNNQKNDSLEIHSFRMDKKERCFVRTQNYGEVLLADAPRFWLLNHLDESGSYFVFGERHFPLTFSE
jgi:hypothetical protein